MRTSSKVWLCARRSAPEGHFYLFIIPHAEVIINLYRRWVDDLPMIGVHVEQYPGHQHHIHAAFDHHLHERAAPIATALIFLTDLPSVLLGQSRFVTVGYKIVRWIKCECGAWVKRLFVSGRQATSWSSRGSVDPRDDKGLLTWAAHSRGPFKVHVFLGDRFYLDQRRRKRAQEIPIYPSSCSRHAPPGCVGRDCGWPGQLARDWPYY